MLFDETRLIERFRSYAEMDTTSDETSQSLPRAAGEWKLAEHLAEELRRIGMKNVQVTPYGYVLAVLPAQGKQKPVMGLIAHMDTSPEANGSNVSVCIHSDYDGGVIPLNEQDVLDPVVFPELKQYQGQTILTSDGKSLLGADDKAGICAIVSACEYLLHHPDIPHGEVHVAFTPDEEIGRGTEQFPLEAFGAAYAYTVDGGELGELSYETFNASEARILFHGVSVHPGEAKGKMRNAVTIAAQWLQGLPAGERPEYTEDHEGFYHVTSMQGTVEQAEIRLILRDHDAEKLKQREHVISAMTELMNTIYGAGTAEIFLKESYRNMKEYILPVFDVVEQAKRAMRKAGVEPKITAVRGGTDGASLSAMGLPCPNLFTGGHNFHGRFEYLPVRSLAKCAETLVFLIRGDE